MTDEQIALELKTRLNKEGESWGLHFEVSKNARRDGAWTQFYVKVDEVRSNRAASRQIMSDVSEDVVAKVGREVVLIPVGELSNAA